MENRVRENVTGRRDSMREPTLSPYTSDTPRSKRSAEISQEKYRSKKGLSNPMEDLKASTLSLVASIPIARIALSPGMTDITTKVMRETKKSTKSADKILFKVYLSISYFLYTSLNL